MHRLINDRLDKIYAWLINKTVVLLIHAYGLKYKYALKYVYINEMHGLMECTYGLIKYMPVLINICTDKKNYTIKLNVHTS